MDSKLYAIGGYYSNGITRTYPGVATLSLSSSGQWNSWISDEKQSNKRNGFMAIEIPISLILDLCHMEVDTI